MRCLCGCGRTRHISRIKTAYRENEPAPRDCEAGSFSWLGDRDSNPNYLIQNQVFYP